MSLPGHCCRLLALAGITLLMSGCLPNVESQSEEQLEAHFQSGQSRVKTMDYEGAAEAFERALEVNPQNGSAHYELGLIYDQKQVDPAAAIYHYNRYLKLRPKAGNAEMIRSRIVACKQELASTISLSPATVVLQGQVQKLAEENRALREELDRWRAYAPKLQLMTNPPPLQGASGSRPERVDSGPAVSSTGGSPPGPGPGSTTLLPPDSRVSGSAPGGSESGSTALANNRTESSRPRVGSASGRTTQPQSATRSARAASASNPRPSSVPSQPSRYHEIRANESLAAIAQRYGISVQKLQQANPRMDPRRPRTGQTLVIPAR